MRKLMNKIAAATLALAMTLSVSAPAFAASVIDNDASIYNGTYPIVVKIDNNGDGYVDKTINTYLNSNGTYVDSTGTTQPKYTSATPIENATTATAFDALFATGKVDTYSATEYLDTETWEGTGIYGISFTKFDDKSGTSKALENGQTRYFFWDVDVKYDGDTTFTHCINYATNYKASDISEVLVTYTYMDY